MIEIKKDPSRKELVVFALLFALFLCFVGWLTRGAGYPGVARALWWSALPVAGAGGVIAHFLPALMRPFYLGWMYAAYPIGWTVSLAILAVVYYGILTPIGLALRIAGKDSMQRRFEPSSETYWREHDPGGEPSRYFRQF